ncbi:FkbM family methyltransferase [Cyanobium sp. Maggiore-St4-Cus]|uniref:FkbM family methyltransferase n=1 Tax=Cyanobium sp. Maggiore-St4-Cus TaxID=2823717 RepID=UPI0020CD58C5|nr:FkbM family methyltransferase [Cyanobium sp. Maggiore-St4-Cus]MCP9787686.1 FkbM family methyltransferase [Cyanobium sp. Maggiore-St4-Cus]
MKEAIRSIFRRFNLDLITWPHGLERLEPQVISASKHYPVNGLIDVGACSGAFYRSLKPFCDFKQVLLIEPQAAMASMLAREFPSRNVHVFNAAVAKSCGISPLYIYGSPDFSSLLKPSPEGLKIFQELRILKETKNISTSTLDSLIAPVVDDALSFVLKIDAQGLDYQIIQSSPAALALCPIVCVEAPLIPIYEEQATFQDLYDFMCKAGYSISSISPVSRNAETSEIVELNLVFVKSRI